MAVIEQREHLVHEFILRFGIALDVVQQLDGAIDLRLLFDTGDGVAEVFQFRPGLFFLGKFIVDAGRAPLKFICSGNAFEGQ